MDGYDENLCALQGGPALTSEEVEELMNDEFWGPFIRDLENDALRF